MLTKITGVFAVTATIAGLLVLVLEPRFVFVAWIGGFSLTCLWLLIASGMRVIVVRRGYRNVLDHLAAVISRGRGESVFVFAAYNIMQTVMRHSYFRTTDGLLAEDEFDSYTRVVALRTREDRVSCIDLIRHHYKNPNFSLHIMQNNDVLPINLLLVSPRYTVIGLPRDTTDNNDWSDSVALIITSQLIYTAFRPLAEWTQRHATEIKGRRVLSDAELESILNTFPDP